MSMIQSMRGMIGDMYAVYAIDLGVELGLFDELAASEEPVDIRELAERADCRANDDMLHGWMRAVQAAGIVNVDENNRVSFQGGWREALTDPTSTEYVATLPRCYIALAEAYPRFAELFREGKSLPWQKLGKSVVEDISADSLRAANFFIKAVVPRVPGLREKLENGARVCDVGCSAGHMTIRLAEAFSSARFVGIDPWQDAIDLAKQHAAEHGVADRVTFQMQCASELPGGTYDIVLLNDVLHEMDQGLRVKALHAICGSLRKGGGLFFSDPIAPAAHSDFLKPSSRVPSITLFFETPFGAKVHTRLELERFLREAGFGAPTEIESTDTDICVYLEPVR